VHDDGSPKTAWHPSIPQAKGLVLVLENHRISKQGACQDEETNALDIGVCFQSGILSKGFSTVKANVWPFVVESMTTVSD
jgi:hypothetical protein